MQKAGLLPGRWLNVVFFLITLLVVAGDQLSKLWVRSYSESQTIFEAGLFRIIRAHNTGAAFGLFQDQSLLLTIIALISVVVMLVLVFLFSRHLSFLSKKSSRLALGLVLGGTIGNLIDRIHLGYVTDFIDIGIWPAFNIADSAITVGVILFAYSLISLTSAKT